MSTTPTAAFPPNPPVAVPDAALLVQEWSTLANDVGRFDLDSAQRLRDVAQTLGTSQEDRWLEVGITQHLGLDSIERHSILAAHHNRELLKRLEWARNVLILFPVFLTWLGLFFAAVNYQAAVGQRPNLEYTSFLLLWQRNFDGLGNLPSIPFGDIALADAVLLLIIVGLTFMVHRWRDFKEVEAADAAAFLRRRIESVAWKTASYLADKRLQQRHAVEQQWDQRIAIVDRFNPIAQDTLDVLAAEQQRIDQLVDNYEQKIDALHQVWQNLSQSVVSVPAAVQQMSQANGQLLVSLQSSLNGLLTQMQQVTAQQGQVQGVLSSVSNDIRTASGAFTAAANVNAQAATAADQAAKGATDLARQLKASQDSLQAGLERATNSIGASAQSLTGIFSGLDVLQGRLDGLVQVNQQLAVGMSTLAQQQQPVLTKIDQALEGALSSGLQLQTSHTELLQQTQTLQGELRQYAAQMNSAATLISQTTNALLQNLPNAIAETLRRITTATPRLTSAGDGALPSLVQPSASQLAPQLDTRQAGQEKRGGFLSGIFGGGSKS